MQLTIKGVTIVDTRDGSLTPDMAIVMDGGKITKIGPSGNITVTGSTKTVEARGKFAVPGFLDCHCHPLNASEAAAGHLTLMLANGITGFRQMSGTTEILAARRAGTLMPSSPAPELLEIAGPILTHANAATPEIAVAEVRMQQAQGADFIKVIDISPAVFAAVAAETKRLGIHFLGHLNPDVSPADAARAGMRSIEHLGPRDALLLGCSTDESALRELVAQQRPKTAPPISGPIPEAMIRRAIANPAMFTSPAELARYQRVIDTFSEGKLAALAAEFVAGGTWQVPTLIRIRTQMRGDDQVYRTNPNLRYIDSATKQMWEELAQQFAAKFSAEAHATLDALFNLQLNVVKPLKDGGVKLMAGSDSGGAAGWNIPGFSIHQEFDLLEAAGLSPLDVLQMTTLNGAEFLGRESRMGTVDEGKEANLVLLDANPIASIQNLHKISAVVRAGTHFASDDLAAMKQRTEETLESQPPPTRPLPPRCC